MSRRAALVLAAACLFAGCRSRPRYVFVNETDRHEHDLALKMSLKLAEKRSGVENALILLRRLPPGKTIQETAVDLFRRWRIGADRSGRGVLYLYSEEENLFKIEVSYALESVFPDALCRRLESAAQTYMLSEIPQDFLSELLITMNLRAQDAAAAGGDLPSRPAWLTDELLSGGGGVKARGYRRTLGDVEAAVDRLPAASLAAFGASSDPEETLSRYLRSLELGIGDPRLPLLTEGSRVFRAVVPRNQEQQRRVFDYYAKALPPRLIFTGAWGLAVFRPGVPNLPVVLRRGTDSRWSVDEAKSWTYFHRYEDGTDFFPNYADLPFIAGLRRIGHPNADQAVYADRVRTPAAPAYPFSLTRAVSDLEARLRARPDDDELWAELGELYLFEMDWLPRSLACFEKAAALAPQKLAYRWRLWDLYVNDSQMEKALATQDFIARSLPRDAGIQSWREAYRKLYDFKRGEF